MKSRALYVIIVIFVFLLGYKVVSNMNKRRGMTKTASDRFVKNFGKIVGAQKMDAQKENPDAEINAMIEASGRVSDFELQIGDEKINCVSDVGEGNLKELKKSYLKMFRKCRDEECSQDEKDDILLIKQSISQCIDDNELGQEE